MAIVDFIFRSRRSQIDNITIDAVIHETHTSTAVCTENPIEGGSVITDHVALKPTELEIEGIITDTPVSFSLIDNATGIINTVKGFTGNKSRSIEAYDKLIKLQQSRRPFKAVTGLKVYNNMILENISVTRDANTGKAIIFKAQMKQILIAASKTTGDISALNTDALASDVVDLASKTADRGSVAIDRLSDIAGNVVGGAAQIFTLFAPLL